MKTIFQYMFAASLLCAGRAWAQDDSSYKSFITQTQYPSGVEYTPSMFTDIAPTGVQVATDLEIDPGGAMFELWTWHSSGAQYLLASRYVGVVPVATVKVLTEDLTAEIPQTRADRPFTVEFTVSKITGGLDDPEAARSVTPLRQEYSYGENGDGSESIDWEKIAFRSVDDLGNLSTVGTETRTLTTIVPGDDRFKLRGEEKFSIYSLDLDPSDPNIGIQEISSQRIKIWPVADGTISGIAQGAKVRFKLPTVTLTLNDLYPCPTNSTVKLVAYQGEHQVDAPAEEVWSWRNTEGTPQDRMESVDLSSAENVRVFDEDGRWTIELRTVTPFGEEQMKDPDGNWAYVTFDLDRNVQLNGSFNTIE